MRVFTGLVVWLGSVNLAMAGDLVGRIVPPYPEALHDIGGSCMTLTAGYEHVCDYSVGVLAAGSGDAEARPDIRYLVAGRMAGREGSQARWLITDAVLYPKASDTYHLQIGSCRLNGHEDARVIAIVRGESEGELLTDVLWARRLDLPAGKFEAVDPKTVDCINEAYLGL